MTTAQIKTRLQELVSACPLLAQRPVLVETKGNLVSLVETTLQTQSLCVVIALASGETKDGSLRRRANWGDSYEVVIHRGLLDGDDVPATDDVLDDLRARIHGEQASTTDRHAGAFACGRHDLRDAGDGTYGRVLTVRIEHPVSAPAS